MIVYDRYNHSFRHVKDVSIPDGAVIPPNTPFVKTWRIRNEGTPWPSGTPLLCEMYLNCVFIVISSPLGCHLLYISKKTGDRMGSPDFIPITTGDVTVKTNEEVDISISLVSPPHPGKYTGYWRLCSPSGKKFGQRVSLSCVTFDLVIDSSFIKVWVTINVV
jgi:hypothetical protein